MKGECLVASWLVKAKEKNNWLAIEEAVRKLDGEENSICNIFSDLCPVSGWLREAMEKKDWGYVDEAVITLQERHRLFHVNPKIREWEEELASKRSVSKFM